MSASTAFFSTCPTCQYPRLQNVYDPIELIDSLNSGQPIDAYCLTCDVVWPINVHERFLLITLIAADQYQVLDTGY